MSAPSLFLKQDNMVRFKRRKARFSFSEVHILLDEVRKNRQIVVGEFYLVLTSKTWLSKFSSRNKLNKIA